MEGLGRAILIATVTAMVVMLAILALVALAIPVGVVAVIILFDDPDAGILHLAGFLLHGVILVAPISMVILPALAIPMHGRHRSLRWLLLPAGLVAGQWWGHWIAPYLYTDADAASALFSLLGGVGGLAASMILARWLRRSSIIPN